MTRNAIIMAAGKGTRMHSDVPKVLHQVMNESMVKTIAYTLKEACAERIVAIAGFKHELVEKELEGICECALQEPQLGTGHAVMQARQLENEKGPVLVVNGDGPCVTKETYAALYDSLNDADMTVLTFKPADAKSYGRVIRSADGSVEKIVEFKDASEEEKKVNEVNAGFYAFDTEKLFEGLKELKNDNAQQEYYITDLVAVFRSHGWRVNAVCVEDETEVMGVNDCVELSEANRVLQKRINTYWMKQGVSMVKPDSVFIGPRVTIGKDVVIHPNVYLYGNTTVGDNAVIYPGVFLVDGEVKEGEEKH